MMQRLKTTVHCSADSKRKLAFLRLRKVSRIDRQHRHPVVEREQYKDRKEALDKSGIVSDHSTNDQRT